MPRAARSAIIVRKRRFTYSNAVFYGSPRLLVVCSSATELLPTFYHWLLATDDISAFGHCRHSEKPNTSILMPHTILDSYFHADDIYFWTPLVASLAALLLR